MSDDLISRQDAIKAVGDVHPLDYNKQAILERIKALPSAERVGKWERKWHTFFKRELPCCSACGKFEAFERNYCPECGADMRGEIGC